MEFADEVQNYTVGSKLEHICLVCVSAAETNVLLMTLPIADRLMSVYRYAILIVCVLMFLVSFSHFRWIYLSVIILVFKNGPHQSSKDDGSSGWLAIGNYQN